MNEILIRNMTADDNLAVAQIIRTVMTEFGAVGPGFSIEDPEVDSMFEAYNNDRSVFYIVEDVGQIVGCGGVAPLAGSEAETCELRKMYFLPSVRGKGAGRVLGELLIKEAMRLGFKRVYIETLERMAVANRLYAKLGFVPQLEVLGSTGHCGCDKRYVLDLFHR